MAKTDIPLNSKIKYDFWYDTTTRTVTLEIASTVNRVIRRAGIIHLGTITMVSTSKLAFEPSTMATASVKMDLKLTNEALKQSK